MNMKITDVIYYVGLMAGAGATYTTLEKFAVEPHMLRLVIALVVGVGAGWAAEKLYRNNRGDQG